MRSPGSSSDPEAAATEMTVPVTGAEIDDSIFMASMTATVSPAST